MERRVRDSCGNSRTKETPQAQGAPRRLGPPAESECPTFQSNVQICTKKL
ncbi:hypothetical protein KEH51_18085 [[Brevibacterium] frigoritolerans]|uniref:Uncharacterized protein n=1 Tax=Peribacillus frigoritolerans TaxID=450367 RepID=A0A941FPQ7_9BACI|nr:hypothetical protein [Peribacillus frigoritolerans]